MSLSESRVKEHIIGGGVSVDTEVRRRRAQVGETWNYPILNLSSG